VIATLATFLLTSGFVVSKELLRLTSPRLMQPGSPPLSPVRASAPAMRSGPEAAISDGASEVEQLAGNFRALGSAARKISVLGTPRSEGSAHVALALARSLARHAKVVLVDLSPSHAAAAEASIDPAAPGLAELMMGDASFGQIITRDRASTLQLVGAGRPGSDRSLLQSPRLVLAFDALMQAYDHVVLDAGAADDLPASLLTSNARAVVAPDASMSPQARAQMCEQLKAVGFADVTMLNNPPAASPSQVVAA
jgi:Mrp family chromosome partitioning ATPase